MKKEEFTNLIKKKSVVALLKLLDEGILEKVEVDSETLYLIIKELKTRKLSESERKIFNSSLKLYDEEILQSPQEKKEKGTFSKKEMEQILGSFVFRAREKRYDSLRNISNKISVYGDFLLLVAFLYLLYITFFSRIQYGFLYGAISLFGIYVSRLFIKAFAELILVWMDIESNTRK